MSAGPCKSSFFFFNDTATTEIYTLSLHDALPIFYDKIKAGEAKELRVILKADVQGSVEAVQNALIQLSTEEDRKSTRLNSSHSQISYAVFCLKKKKTANGTPTALRTRRLRYSIHT